MTYTYLASPYTHPDPAVREDRFRRACVAAGHLMLAGEVVFCPIAHSHPIDSVFIEPQTGAFWERQDNPFLLGASKIVVLRLEGWEKSLGIAGELLYAQTFGVPVEFIDP